MDEVKADIGFWKRVRSRAFAATVATFASNLRKTVWVVIFTVLAASAWVFIVDPEDAIKKVLWFLLPIVAYILIFPFMYAWRFIQALPELEKELWASRATEIRRHDELEESLKREIEVLSNEISRLSQSSEAERHELQQKVEQASRNDPKKNAFRQEVNDRIQEFRAVMSFCDQKNVQAVHKFYGIDKQTFNFLKENLSEYIRYGKKYPVVDTYSNMPQYSDKEYERIMRVCNYRIACLNEVLEHLG